VGDGRRRGRGTVWDAARAERLAPLPAAPYPATLEVERVVSAASLVAYQGNRYSIPPGLEGARVTLHRRLGAGELEIRSPAGQALARHPLAPAGAGALRRLPEHRAALEEAVLGAFTTARPCRRKANRPPGEAALLAARALAGEGGREVVVDLERYAAYAGGVR
jgi:hypothetical protein